MRKLKEREQALRIIRENELGKQKQMREKE